ncbi:MAG TPA: pseudouridine-5'-phosphate glycosidase [Trueperaceae bacterium]
MTVRIHPRVRAALRAGGGVVALESTVVTHGLPRPQNLELARSLEAAVAEAGAVPATVGLVKGELTVGLDDAELERLATEPADKASLWNLAGLAASGRTAGTTVAATLHAANQAGVQVFATGGIGGVHPAPFDESADLRALARNRVITVCSGPKSVLDAGATLERLETLGVPVLGYRSNKLAGFYIPETDWPLPLRCNDAKEIAALYNAQASLGLAAGPLVSKPVSKGLEPAQLHRWTEQAQREAVDNGIAGKDLTPFLLARLAQLSDGRTVTVNLRLLEENARLAAQIALALAAGRQARRLTQV